MRGDGVAVIGGAADGEEDVRFFAESVQGGCGFQEFLLFFVEARYVP